MLRLNVIGCGRAASTLARLWREQGQCRIGRVVNRTLASSRRAVEFLGDGEPADSLLGLPVADLTLIGVADDAIVGVAERLAGAGGSAGLCFHLSGSQPSSALAALRSTGGGVASVHPVKSFADPARAISDFAGTWCGIEGDAEAVSLLEPLVMAIGGLPFRIDPDNKTLYHAASVMVCNYLNALMEAGLRCYEQAGIDRQTAMALAMPLVSATLGNIREMGPARALTGPIARGDDAVVAEHLKALSEAQPGLVGVYRGLGLLAVELSGQLGTGDAEGIERVQASLLGVETVRRDTPSD